MVITKQMWADLLERVDGIKYDVSGADAQEWRTADDMRRLVQESAGLEKGERLCATTVGCMRAIQQCAAKGKTSWETTFTNKRRLAEEVASDLRCFGFDVALINRQINVWPRSQGIKVRDYDDLKVSW